MTSGKHDSKLWEKYYAAQNANRAPSSLLRKAIRRITARSIKTALDLGCGTGRDTHFLLSKGYRVYALDAQVGAISFLRKSIPARLRRQLSAGVIRFEHVRQRDLPQLSLINASFSIFFCRPSSFQQLWRNLTHRLEYGGIFCGQFIGPRDTWAKKRGYTAVSRNRLMRLLSNFEVIQLSEQEDDSGTITGMPKHWHLFTVIARKKTPPSCK